MLLLLSPKFAIAVIIGNGNVALDVARVLAKGRDELAGSDLPPDVLDRLTAHSIEKIHIVGRRGAADSKFNDHELAELGTLQRARPRIADPSALTGETVVLGVLRGFAARRHESAEVRIVFHFNLTPVAFLGDGHLQAVQFRSSNGDRIELPAQLAVTCIGYETLPCCTATVANGVFPNQDGKISDRLYTVGWAKRGPSGTIPTNRTEGQQVAQKIAQEIIDSGGASCDGLRRLLQQRGVRWIDYASWKRIDAAELARREQHSCRGKFTSLAEMMAAAEDSQLRNP